MMKKIICIVGPTSVGKTDMAVKIAKAFNGEIISGDSIQIYKELDIGSAKVTQEEMAGIKHHLIDVKTLDDNYSVYEFQKSARNIIDEISAKHKLPLVVGGTGLYIKSLIYDYVFNEETETFDNKKYDNLTNEELYKLLQEKDYETSLTIHINNRKRIIRALNIIEASKQKKSDILKKQEHQPIYDALIIGLTCERDILYERINKRVDIMMNKGLLQEVENLYLKYQDSLFEKQGMQGIGYREFRAYFDNEQSLEEVIENIKKHSRQFAKRQYTWFNNQLNVHWFDIFEENYEKQLFDVISKWLNG